MVKKTESKTKSKKEVKVKDYNGYLFVKYRDNKKLIQKYFGKSSPTNRREAENFIKDLTRNLNEKVYQTKAPVDEIFDRFLHNKLTDTSTQGYKTAFNLLMKHFGAEGILKVDKQAANDLVEYLLDHYSKKTAEIYVKYLSSFYTYLYENKLVKENPLKKS